MEPAEKYVRLRLGDRVVVQGMPFEARICEIFPKDRSGRVRIKLDWGIHGYSHVWLHDEGRIWQRYIELN